MTALSNWISQRKIQTIAWTLSLKVRSNSPILANEISNGISIIDYVIEKAPGLLFEIDEYIESSNNNKDPEITLELVRKMVDWDRINKNLKPYHFRMMFDIAMAKRS